MAAKRLVPLLALGLTLAGAPAAHAATHATVSYSPSTGFDIEDLDGQKNDIRLTIEPPFSGEAAASLTFEEVAKDSANATFPLQAGAGCSQFQENFQPEPSKVICNLPQSGSRNFLLNLGGGDDHINWALGTQSGFFKNSLLHVNGGAGDDFVHISQDPTSAVAGSTWSGGDGDDDLRYSGGAAQTMLGNAGDDSVAGDAGNDTLDGGDGNDILEGNQGQDTFKGGDGDDRLVSHGGSFAPNVIEVMDGGAGTDTIDLSQENNSLGAPLGGHAVISLDGVANDKWVVTGPPDAGGVGTTHNYQLTAIENVIGTPAVGVSPPRDGNDTITGDAFANTLDGQSGNDTINAAPTSASAAFINSLFILGPLPPPPIIQPIFTGIPPKDTLIGGPGDDELDGSQKSDVIDGGVGTDTIFGSGGGDSITSKDVTTTGSVFTDTVDCGDGTDAVTADLQDAGHLTNCENADISPGREGKHIRFNRRLKAGRGGRVKVHLHCPRGASIPCNGSLALKVGRKIAGRSAHYKVARGRKRTIALTLARAFMKRTPFAAFMVASEKGRFGHKTTRLRVIVR